MTAGTAERYVVTRSVVTVFEPQRAIAWTPGQLDESGKLETGGWYWRYDLVPNSEGTDVTLTYDWSGTPQQLREAIGGLPPFPEDFIESSLEALDRAVR